MRENANANILRILMNADDDMAVAYLTAPEAKITYEDRSSAILNEDISDEPLQWRKRMAESIAMHINVEKFGVKGIYLYGSVFNEKATASADIDLIIHFGGTPRQKQNLEIWLDAWNSCLCQINYNKSGFMMRKILDVNIIEDSEFEKRKYIAGLLDLSRNLSKKLKLNRK